MKEKENMKDNEKALSIRLPVELYEKLSDLAHKEGRTLNAQANQLLVKGFIRIDQEKRAIRKLDEGEEDDVLPLQQTRENTG